MKICLIGDSTGNIDEGMKNIIFNLSRELSNSLEVLEMNPLDAFHFSFWQKILESDSDIYHYISGPSIYSFLLMKCISAFTFTRKRKIIMSSPLPSLSPVSCRIIPFLRPDLIIVQSRETEKKFQKCGIKTHFLSISGVDLQKFQPVTKDKKCSLRKKYGIPDNKFVVLHVGHINDGRNIRQLIFLQSNPDFQVLVVGSSSTEVDWDLHNDLKNAGCIVICEYLPDIEEVYGLSDCYIFPTLNNMNCIQIPISVIEAMATNIPVITTIFGGLPDLFCEDDGVIFENDPENWMKHLEILSHNSIPISNRVKIESYSWATISENLKIIYIDLWRD